MKIRTLLEFFWGSPRKRYEARHDVLTALAIRMGFRTYNRNLSWVNDAGFLSIWKNFPDYKSVIHDRKYVLYGVAKSLRYLDGDIAECGVIRGGSSFLMLSALADTGKFLHGFDSFQGLSKPKFNDRPSDVKTFNWRENDMGVPIEVTSQNLSSFSGNFKLYKGWIPDRFNEVEEKKFSLVHIDLDLFEPTIFSLEFFFPRMVAGGVIICDDYGFESCPGSRKAMDEFFGLRGLNVIPLTTGQGLVMIPHRVNANEI